MDNILMAVKLFSFIILLLILSNIVIKKNFFGICIYLPNLYIYYLHYKII